MIFSMDALDQSRSYKLLSSVIVPRPIAWVVSHDAAGNANAAPYSLFNFFGGHPPVVGIGMGRPQKRDKDSLANIRATGEFVINLVPARLAQAMNTTATPFPAEVDELREAGLQTLPCSGMAGVRIKDSPVALECRLWQIVDLPPSSVLVLATVELMHIDDEHVTDPMRCHIDGAGLSAIGRMESPGWYTRTDDRFMLRQRSVLAHSQDSAAQAAPTMHDAGSGLS